MRFLIPCLFLLLLIGCTNPAAPPDPSAVVLNVPGMT
jgi:hypothetical protein